jgi:hypothetical protein
MLSIRRRRQNRNQNNKARCRYTISSPELIANKRDSLTLKYLRIQNKNNASTHTHDKHRFALTVILTNVKNL